MKTIIIDDEFPVRSGLKKMLQLIAPEFEVIGEYETVKESIAALKIEQPDLVFLSSEPFPFKEKHVKKFESLYPAAKIIIVDGEMFSWYGSRLKHAPNYFQKLLKQIAID